MPDPFDIVHECNYALFQKYSYLLGTVQFSLRLVVFDNICIWKNPCTLSTNSAYYCYERAYHQIYQFHLEGVALASAFVSKSELFEDKHSIVQSVAPPLFLYPSPPFPLPTSKQKGSDEGLERNGKQIVHLYLGGDQTLEQILSAFSLLHAPQWSYLKVGRRQRRKEARPEQSLFLKSQTGDQMCKWERSWSMITFRTDPQRY